METLIIEGRVLPERRRVSLPKMDIISYRDPRGFDAEFLIKVVDGKVQVECSIAEVTEWYLQMSIVRAYEIVTNAVDLYAFSKGWSLQVILDDYIASGVRQGIAFSETSVVCLCTSISNDDDFLEAWNVLHDDFNLKFAFRDLVMSLSTLNYSSIAACRAIEAVRISIAPSDYSVKASWQLMREKLRIDRPYLQLITDVSREPRHGNRGSAFGEEQLVITHRAWRIMDRYMEYIKRGANESLPENEFPLLR